MRRGMPLAWIYQGYSNATGSADRTSFGGCRRWLRINMTVSGVKRYRHGNHAAERISLICVCKCGSSGDTVIGPARL
jgi:hypothetical protein